MPEGTIKRLMDKGFGFINTGKAKDLFFHSSNVQDVSFEELREGQRVSFTEGQGPKGPQEAPPESSYEELRSDGVRGIPRKTLVKTVGVSALAVGAPAAAVSRTKAAHQ